ncbi:MAG: RluA family pseudouridine synthase [Acidimicrobiia bacterium]|nr:RluA family pseudouridine synthase [Acidimicrobiia bacterium]
MAETFEVPAALDGERVDRAVALLSGWSRAEVQALIEAGAVLVGGGPAPKSRRLSVGDVVDVLAEPGPEALPYAEDVAVDVRYEDDHVVVVSKPAGLVVHPGAGNATGTLVNGLLALYPEIAEVGEAHRPGIVHRLDRDTSGLLVVARTAVAYDGLVSQLKAREMERRYLALVWGSPSPRGMIDAPIGRSASRRTRMAIRDAGREARTGFEVVESFPVPEVSLLECRLETGRTHQIRVHLAAIGHPVVGDATYGGARSSLEPGRPFLHAFLLEFEHPVSGERVRVEDALPDALEAVLDGLRS